MASYVYKLIAFTILMNLVFGFIVEFESNNTLAPDSTIFDTDTDLYNAKIKTLADEPGQDIGFIEGAIDKLDATVGNTLRITKVIWDVLISAFNPLSLNGSETNDKFEQMFIMAIGIFRILTGILTGVAIYQLTKRGSV